MRLPPSILSALALTIALPATIAGADSLTVARAEVSAVRLEGPISLDGILSEPVWSQTTPATDFKQRDPDEGAAPSQRTEVRMAYDDEALYVGARLYDTVPDSILARLTRRDFEVPCDRFIVYLDPLYDRRSGYYFTISAAGTLLDGTLYNDGWTDASWDGVWEGRAKVDAQGWTAEMRIPFSQLRFRRGSEYRWGVNFARAIQRRNEWVYLAYQPKKESGFVSRFPDLVGIRDVQPSRSIELLPYATTKAEYLRHEAFDPFNDGSRYVPDGGVDLRTSLGSQLKLNATVNPDFGQVEVDPAVVNLSDTESFFQEKRPFFVEGSSIFNFGNQGADDYWGFNWPEPIFFYSRRVGRNPQGFVPDADYTDVPIGTSILGAAKLTGKLSPSWNFGTLHALTARETAELDDGGTRSEWVVEPLTYYGVARGLREFKDRQHGFGLMTTVASRSFDQPGLRNQLNSESVVSGFDGWTFLDKSQTWVVSGWSAMSHVRGNTARMTRLQRNSRHYFQRPDADHVEVDPDATSLTGFGSRYWLNRQKGSMLFNAALGFMDPKFDVADVGFQNRADVINGHVGGGWRWTETTKIRKYQNVLGALFASYDFQGNPVWNGVWAQSQTEFANNYSWTTSTAYNPQTINNRLTRGGPLTVNKPGYELYNYLDTDGKAKWFYFVEGGAYVQPEAGDLNAWVNPGVEWKPASNLTLRVGPNYTRNVEVAHYLQTVEDPNATATFGSRYVFGRLDQTTIGAQIRLNCAFTPNLSLQLFAQPLISSGHYTEFKELARPRSFAFNPLTADGSYNVDPDGPGSSPAFTLENSDFGTSGNPDFTIREMRGNAVLRWEYMPGSTLFLVWTQERSDFEAASQFDFGPTVRKLVDAEMNNIFLAKVTYYLNL
ncbi:MAG TPA: DUF5916 domain-containing protein [Candidatus Limnocylindria bacterium]|nr:DUF5916 domain-containing protein [Candidatus Limnocylindria bacterium]